MRVVLDPGHGGRDPGACGPATTEASNVLKLALLVGDILKANNIEVFFTRTSNTDFCPDHYSEDTDLANRVAVANKFAGDIFVALHDNSGGGHGNEVWAWKPGGEAERLAHAINKRMSTLGMPDRGVRFAGWYVCRKTDPPAALVEYGFIDTEESTIIAKMQAAALAIAQGIGDFFGVSIGQTKKEDYDVEKAVLAYGIDDFLVPARRVSAKNGNCAIFLRTEDHKAPTDAFKAKQLIVVGGGSVGHPNEVLLTGQSWADTCAAVGRYGA